MTVKIGWEWLVLAGAAVAIIAAFIFSRMGSARSRRRLRRTHSRLVSTQKRPMVKFSVRTPKRR